MNFSLSLLALIQATKFKYSFKIDSLAFDGNAFLRAMQIPMTAHSSPPDNFLPSVKKNMEDPKDSKGVTAPEERKSHLESAV